MKKAFTALNNLIPPVTLKSRSSTAPANQETLPKWMLTRHKTTSKTSVDSRTRHLIQGLDPSNSDSTNLRRMEDICTHLKDYPITIGTVSKVGW